MQAKFEQKGKFVAKKQKGKQRRKRVLEKQEQSELGWGGFDDVAPPTKTTVVLRHMFHPDEFAADFSLREQLEDDVTEEAAKLGRASCLAETSLILLNRSITSSGRVSCGPLQIKQLKTR